MTEKEIREEIIETYGAQKQLSELLDHVVSLQTRNMKKLMELNQLLDEKDKS
jgi:predicted transport protein